VAHPAIAFAAAAAVLIAGCAGTGRTRSVAIKLDPSTLAATESIRAHRHAEVHWPRADWWVDYGDAQLDQLMTTALQGQPSVRVAEARFRLATAASKVSRAAMYPEVNAAARGTRQRFSENGVAPPSLAGEVDSINDINVGLSYDLDLWGRDRAALEASLDRASAGQVDVQAARLMLTSAVARTYFALSLAHTQLDIAQAALHQRQQLLSLTQHRVDAHLDSRVELTLAETLIPTTRKEIFALTESIIRLENQLALLAGKGPDAGRGIHRPMLGHLPMIGLPSEIPAELIGRRPDVVAARWRVEAAAADVDVARTQFYPNISLNAFVGAQSVGLDNLVSIGSRVLGIGPAITLPIFNGGRLRGVLAANQAAYDVAVEQYNGTLVSALHDVVEQLVQLQSLERQVREQEDALALSEQSLRLANARYGQGLENFLHVLKAEGDVLAQRRLSAALHSRQAECRMNLDRALGGGALPIHGPSNAAVFDVAGP